MSLDFKLHYDRLREGDPTKPEDSTKAGAEGSFYNNPGYVRSLCLIWPDGKQQFFNYAYLVGGTFMPGEEINEISLNFSTYIVIIKGHGLDGLFVSLLDHLPKQILQVDSRYATTPAITEIVVKEL